MRCDSFGKALKHCRESSDGGKGITQSELSTLACVSVQTISSWENELTQPLAENYKALLDLLPDLANHPKPECEVRGPGRIALEKFLNPDEGKTMIRIEPTSANMAQLAAIKMVEDTRRIEAGKKPKCKTDGCEKDAQCGGSAYYPGLCSDCAVAKMRSYEPPKRSFTEAEKAAMEYAAALTELTSAGEHVTFVEKQVNEAKDRMIRATNGVERAHAALLRATGHKGKK